MKFYDFLDKQPAIGKLVVIEGTERVLAERALEVVLDRLLPVEVRELNLARFTADDAGESARLREALLAMPFLAERRVVVVTDTQTMRADPRRALWAVAQDAPEGNTLVLLDLLSPRAKQPQPFGVLAGRTALRIDTTAGEETRARFVEETLERLNATAEPRVIHELTRSAAELAAVRNDLEKLALTGEKITVKDLEREALVIEDPKELRVRTRAHRRQRCEGTCDRRGVVRQRSAQRSGAAAFGTRHRVQLCLGADASARPSARTLALARTVHSSRGEARRRTPGARRLRARGSWHRGDCDRSGRQRPRRSPRAR